MISNIVSLVIACSVCYFDPKSQATISVQYGVLLLLVFVGGVLSAIAGIAIKWAKRAKALEKPQA